MTLTESIKLRNDYRDKLIGKPFKSDGWDIIDLIVANQETVTSVYCKMWDMSISNEDALNGTSIKEGDYDMFVISHQWPWGSGDLITESFGSYKTHNTIT
jgi:hypothetical protein